MKLYSIAFLILLFSLLNVIANQTTNSKTNSEIEELDVLLKLRSMQIFYDGIRYRYGARFYSLHENSKKIRAKVVESGEVVELEIQDIFFTNSCFNRICTEDRVSKNQKYRMNAIVLAINSSTNQGVVKSILSGEIFVENLNELSVVTENPIFDRLR